jgi:hypothetical protein
MIPFARPALPQTPLAQAELVEASRFQSQEPWPKPVRRQWHFRKDGLTHAGIFEITNPDTGHGSLYLLSYHVVGEEKPTVERLQTFQMAEDRGRAILSTFLVRAR